MKAITYFEDIGIQYFAKSKETLDVVINSWKQNDWDVIVLSKQDAISGCQKYNINIKNHKSNLYKYTLHGYEYMESCYSRWFAYENFATNLNEPVVWFDIDVINYGFKPKDIIPLQGNNLQPFNNSYCSGYSNNSSLQKITTIFKNIYESNISAQLFANYCINLPSIYNKNSKDLCSLLFSDMTMLEKFVFYDHDWSNVVTNGVFLCVDADLDNPTTIQTAKIVHYHGGIFSSSYASSIDHNQDKYKIIQSIRPV